jgi:hypothetical protein
MVKRCSSKNKSKKCVKRRSIRSSAARRSAARRSAARRSAPRKYSLNRRSYRLSAPKARGYLQNRFVDPSSGQYNYNVLPVQAGCTQNYTADTCGTDPNCNWTMRGCVRKSGVLAGNLVQGPKGPGQAGGKCRRRSSKKRSSKKRKGSKKRSSKKRKGSKRH